jgi:hypothetical protein
MGIEMLSKCNDKLGAKLNTILIGIAGSIGRELKISPWEIQALPNDKEIPPGQTANELEALKSLIGDFVFG